MEVLVVDDDKACRLVFRRELERGGYHVLEANDGLEALNILQKHPVDLVTLDLQMPKMGGLELCDRLWSRDFACHFHQNREGYLPILVITASASVKRRVKWLRRGITDYLVKGFEPGTLLKRVNQILKPANLFTGLKAVLVSKAKETIQILTLRLAELGLQAEPITLCEEGITRASELHQDVDVVFIDASHKEFGPETCTTIRTQLAYDELPIIVMIPQGSQNMLLEWFSAGATDFLTVPFSKGELKAKLGTALAMLRSSENPFPMDLEVFPPLQHHLSKEKISPEQMERERLASTMIHNIGNILTSVVVSSSLLRQNTEESQIWKLNMAHNLLRENQLNLAEFLTTDPKGDKLIQYLLAVGDRLQHEYTQLNHQLRDLDTKIQLMQSMLQMPQTSDGSVAVWENCKVVNLVKPALDILKNTLHRTHVVVRQEIDPDLEIRGPRNKLIHVFINLIKNAIEAMSESPTKELFLSSNSDDETVSIFIRDTGMGLHPDQLDRLFIRGFTTKLNGHGFGLAFCANAVREIHGRIEAQSLGLGHGTLFTIHLPKATAEESS